ncbi:sulfite exporter TauE/SafE family protein [Flavobacteriaceae bacterium]|nr:sulfite exporter TauE/SafE family protein [Flavobacteriaceae bacterium]MDA9015513.1 sulfite exporter TauE/SafE family protein [Flavobacteriaceae bacterium]MDB3862388.1 sulfite exporter TauE/SafE family protein [Flavobacteriaceae bacterium]
MESVFESFLLVIVGFFAGIINTLAGGGSLFTLPVLIFLGLPPSVANGTNRIAIVVQSFGGALGYRSKGVQTYPFPIYLGISASIGAVIGAQIALQLDGAIFNRILAVIMLIVGLLILIRQKSILADLPERLTGKYLVYAILGFFIIGIYGGFINAGIGIVIMLFLNRLNRLSLVKTNATKVLVVMIYSSVALVLFAYNGAVNWKLGLLMALGTLFGAWWASRWSVRKGDRVVRIAMLVTIFIMAIKLWFFE